ncbi:LSU ribosomal protein L3p (L3e) [hydrothermal vent metagenome]|uniref:LSU ribosomal protein L3p (L3e) n=1 Tax=hydrothermal vent metagenome TaxID=652676 RepID=A0A3B0SS98_9ZZZZ
MKAILGEKLGMTQIFDDENRVVPVTVIKAGPISITQIKTEESDGYSAIQVAYKELPERHVNRPTAGHFAKSGVAPAKHVVEIRVDDVSEFSLGQEFSVSDLFEVGQKIDVAGVTKGKGFAGVMKRHNFKGQPASHGAHRVHRAPGAIGACATPARVHKGKRMAGRMGGDTRTAMNLTVAQIDAERGLLMVRGSIPGSKRSIVMVREAVKARG